MVANAKVIPLEAPKPSSVTQKIVKIMSGVSRLAQKGYNEGQKYKFTQDEDVLDLIRPLMVENQLVLYQDVVTSELIENGSVDIENGVVKKQKTNTITRVTYEMTFECAETGEQRSIKWQADAMDNSDKALNKAATAAQKYFLLKTFLISTGNPQDDSDSGAGQSPRRQQPPRQQAPVRQQSNPPAQSQSAPEAPKTNGAPSNAPFNVEALNKAVEAKLVKNKADYDEKLKTLGIAQDMPTDTIINALEGKRQFDDLPGLQTGEPPTQQHMPERYTFDQLTVSTFKHKTTGADEYKLTFRTNAKDADGKLITASTFNFGKYITMDLLTEEQLRAKATVELVGVTGEIEQSGKYWNVVDGSVVQDLPF